MPCQAPSPDCIPHPISLPPPSLPPSRPAPYIPNPGPLSLSSNPLLRNVLLTAKLHRTLFQSRAPNPCRPPPPKPSCLRTPCTLIKSASSVKPLALTAQASQQHLKQVASPATGHSSCIKGCDCKQRSTLACYLTLRHSRNVRRLPFGPWFLGLLIQPTSRAPTPAHPDLCHNSCNTSQALTDWHLASLQVNPFPNIVILCSTAQLAQLRPPSTGARRFFTTTHFSYPRRRARHS